MLRGWVEIQLVNGQKFKYVRDVSGDAGDTISESGAVLNANSYLYGDTIGDTYSYQGDSNEIKYAFDSLFSSFTSGDSLLSFPEYSGNTYIILRPNYDEPLTPARQNTGGDTDIQNILSYRRTTLNKNQIVSMSVVEEFVPPDNVYVP